MPNYHVTKNPKNGNWQVKREGSSRASATDSTQAGAEAKAKALAGNAGGGEVRIHRPNGQIRDSDTVKPGNDPCPPKDSKH